MQIIPGVHGVDGLVSGRAYLILDGDGATLIDTGVDGSAERILGALAALGRGPGDLRRVVLTHNHTDHMGSVAVLAERTGAEVMAHALDAPGVRSTGRAPGAPVSGPLGARTPPNFRAPLPARVDRELVDGDVLDCLGGLQVMHTPGHTPGSICLYAPSHRIIFTGDTAINVFGARTHLLAFATDKGAARASFRKLAELDVETACFGHGRPIRGGAAAAFQRAAART